MAGTACSGDAGLGVKRMMFAELQEPVTLKAGVIVVGAPPDGSTVFSCPWATNPTMDESGDQNGDPAPSVPGSDIALRESSERIQRRTFPSGSEATKTTRRPLGERAKRPMPPSWPAPGNRSPSGRRIDVRYTVVAAGVRRSMTRTPQ